MIIQFMKKLKCLEVTQLTHDPTVNRAGSAPRAHVLIPESMLLKRDYPVSFQFVCDILKSTSHVRVLNVNHDLFDLL